MMVGLPRLTHDPHELPKAVVVRLLAALALAAWAGGLASGQARFRWSRWLAPLGVWALWTAVATAVSESPATSLLGMHSRLDGLLATLTYILLALVASQVMRDSADVTRLTRAVTAAGLLVSGYAVLQALHLDPAFYYPSEEFTAGRVFSTMANPVFLGGYLMLLLPIAVVVGLSDRSKGWRHAAWLTVATTVVAVLATATRAAWLAGGAEILLLVVVCRRRGVPLGREGLVASVAGVLGLVAVAVRSLASSDPVVNVASRFASMFSASDGSLTERAFIRQGALDAIARRPWFGFGPDRFGVAWHLVRPAGHAAQFPSSAVDVAHSVPLQIAATAGVVAALAWAVAILWPLVGTAGRAFSASRKREDLLVAGVWIAVAGYLATSLSGVSVTGASAVLWVLLGALIAQTPHGEGKLAPRAVAVAVALAAAALVVAALVTGVMLLWADADYMIARREVRGYLTGDPTVAIGRALALSPLDITYMRALALQEPDPTKRLVEVRRALDVEPADLTSVLMMFQLAKEGGNATDAQKWATRATALAPNDPMVAQLVAK
jgi:putative inorganic carbon (HCO3(-)) transporter